MTQVPHPFPYQGSKRIVARHILPFIPQDVTRLVEPFCGSAAVSIAAASRKLASSFWLNDIDPALMTLWSWILERPDELTAGYEQLWNAQHPDRDDLTDALSLMNDMGVSYILSYDGRIGSKSHGKPLPKTLGLSHYDVHAGRSSQSTLLGDNHQTIESGSVAFCGG